MSRPSAVRLPTVLMLALLAVGPALGLAGCATTNGPTPPPAPTPTLPPAFPPQDIVGRWGLAAYHREEDRARIEVAAAGQCKQPYIITLGPTGGVMMHLADQAKPEELRLKGAPGGKTYIGPEGPPGGMQDADQSQVTIRIRFKRDGTLAGGPQVLTSGSGVQFNAMRDSAVRAVFIGQPYTMLRPEHYDTWKEIDFTFDTKQMFQDLPVR